MTMDVEKITEIVRSCSDPEKQQQVEEELNKMDNIDGFISSLLKMVMSSEIDLPMKESGAKCLRRLLCKVWADRKTDVELSMKFHVTTDERSFVRETIVDAIEQASGNIQSDLSICLKIIFKNDFPGNCSVIMDKISSFLQEEETKKRVTALLCLYQLVKTFQYKRPEERSSLKENMKVLLPKMYQMCIDEIPKETEESTILLKQILKIYFAYTEYWLPLDLFSSEVFSLWMELFRSVLERQIQDSTKETNETDGLTQLRWKCKKWALRILLRMFEKYGCPGNVSKEYEEFAEWSLKTFSRAILQVILNIVEDYKNGSFITPIVIQHTLNYINESVCHAYSWKYLKPHMMDIVKSVVFPVLSYSKYDNELWNKDPIEYVRQKFDLFENYMSPTMAAQSLLQLCCRKRKGFMESTMTFVLNILTSETKECDKDGALHMIGYLTDIIQTKKIYKEQINGILRNYVFPNFDNPYGHMRARALWLIQRFSDTRYKPESILEDAIQNVTKALLNDTQLPVRVQATIALKMLLNDQEESEKLFESNIKEITIEILNIIQETRNDNLCGVLQDIVHMYTEQIMPIAEETCHRLLTVFQDIIEEKRNSPLCLLNAVESLLTVMQDEESVMNDLEPYAMGIVFSIFKEGIPDLYEEALFVVDGLTARKVSPRMWTVLDILRDVFYRDASEYFSDMMAALYNYVTVDTDTFLSKEEYLLTIYKMCETILAGNTEDDAESHAAKLLEVIILQCKDRIDKFIPLFVELILRRLSHGFYSSEVRTTCMLVVISALIYNTPLFFSTLENLQETLKTTVYLLSLVIKQWICDVRNFWGIHDRKMCVLGLTKLMSTPPPRPSAINDSASEFIPCIITACKGLKLAFEMQAMNGDDSFDDDEVDSESMLESMDQDMLSSEDSETEKPKEEKPDESQKNEVINESVSEHNSIYAASDEETRDGGSEAYDETYLESYMTPIDIKHSDIDEYLIFQDVLKNIEAGDPSWYEALTAKLTSKQRMELDEVLLLADQIRANAGSGNYEQSESYNFFHHTVPDAPKLGPTSGDQ